MRRYTPIAIILLVALLGWALYDAYKWRRTLKDSNKSLDKVEASEWAGIPYVYG